MEKQVSVTGSSEATGDEVEVAYKVGRLIARHGWVLICGGRGGIMEAVCKGAVEEGGITVGIMMTQSGEDANPYVKIKINTGLGHSRNFIVVASGEFVVSIGGRWGTLSEIAFARILGKKIIGYRTHSVDGVENYVDSKMFLKRLEEMLL